MGKFQEIEEAIAHAIKQIRHGADPATVLELGGKIWQVLLEYRSEADILCALLSNICRVIKASEGMGGHNQRAMAATACGRMLIEAVTRTDNPTM